jgi:hypothetical protein
MATALLVLAGCGEQFAGTGTAAGKQGEKAAPADAGKAQDGSFSIRAPGIDMKIDIPAGITSHGDSESDLLYPGSTLTGMHVQGSDAAAGAAGKAGIELRFTSFDPAAEIAAWYRDPARSGGFTMVAARPEGETLVLSGTERADGDPFELRLSPGRGGGTDGRLMLTDRR